MNLITDEFYQEIKKIYPSIQKNEIEIFDDGWDYLVCAVDEKEVFRFPRRNDYATSLPREVKFLDIFSKNSPVRVPDMTLHNLPNNIPYARYPFIIGCALESDIFKKLGDNQIEEVARQLGEFLTSLHSFPVTDAKRMGIEEVNLSKMWEENYEKTQKMIFTYLEEEEKEWTRELFKNFFSTIKKSEITNRLIHGDIMPRHILIDNDLGKLAGIIDFGDLLISDPAFDFAFLEKYNGSKFLSLVYENYKIEKDKYFDVRRQFYESRSFIAELEHAIALEKNEEISRFKALLSGYTKTHPMI